ncbi:MAG: TonB-dependent receptor [Pyrinomonadaceae bacterium]
MSTRQNTLAVLFCLLLISPTVFGQATSATLSGTISDSQGALIPGVKVTIKNTDTGLQRELETNAAGHYSALGLSPGTYELRTDRQGFTTEVRSGLKLTVAEEAVLDIQLNVSGVRETVQVAEAGPAQVDTTTATISSLVDEKKIRDLPLNGRDMAQLVLLQPGVVNSRASVQSANTGRGTRFSVAGSRPSQNLFQLDGTTLNDALNNTPGSAQGLLVGVETVKEFRVLTSTYSAEFGRVAGGVFLAVTKSGTNLFSGSAFEFLRNDNLDARNFFDRCASVNPNCKAGGRPEFRRNQFGFTVGGPIIKNKTFFFGSYEGLREFKGISTVSLVPSDSARLGILPTGTVTVDPRSRPILDLFPRANGQTFSDGTAEFTGTTNRISRDDFFTIRLDHKISNAHSIFARYLYDDSDQVLPRNFPQWPNLAVNQKQVITVEERAILSPTIVNEVRFGLNRSRPAELVPPTSSTFTLVTGRDLGEIAVSGLSAVGTDRTNPKHFFQDNWQLVDNLFISHGQHSLKMGVSFDRFNVFGNSESRTRGQLRFASLSDFLRFRVQDLQGASPNSDFLRNYGQTLWGLYIQDDFKLTRRLAINLGLRYEHVSTPKEANGKVSNLRNITDPTVTVGDPYFKPVHNTFAPRVGFALDVFGDGKTALRGGFGMFYDQPLFNTFRNPIFRSLPFVNRGRLRACGNPPNVPPNCVAALPVDPIRFAGVESATESFAFNLRPSYVMQYNLNAQREVAGAVVSLAYVGSRGVNLFGQADLNTARPQILADGREFFPANAPRRNPAFGAVRTVYQGFSSNYNSMNVGLVKRFSQGLQFQTSYTFGKSIDNKSGTSGRQEYSNGQARSFDPYNLRLDRARSDFDVRHTFVANATYELPFGKDHKGLAKHVLGDWQINTIVTLSSGVPFTVLIDGDPDRDATDENSSRPNLVPGIPLAPPGGSSADLWFNPAAFTAPAVGFRGTAGRNILTGPNFKSVDLSIVKNFHIDERRSLQFRGEIFNVFNRANFDLPSNSEDGELVFNFAAPATFTRVSTAGRIFSTVADSREIQFGFKFIF